MKITKNFLKFKQFLRSKKLKPVQKVIMEYLFELHNVKFGYAFPSMKNLVIEVNGACNNTVISAIRKLEKIGLLKVNRENKNNRYYIENVENFLVGLEKKHNSTNSKINKEDLSQGESLSFPDKNTSLGNVNGKESNTKGLEINEVINETILENKIARDMNCSLEEAVNALKYAKEKHAKNLIAYAKGSIKNGWHRLQYGYNSTLSNIKSNLSFDNFTQRVYDYEKLELELLGWD